VTAPEKSSKKREKKKGRLKKEENANVVPSFFRRLGLTQGPTLHGKIEGGNNREPPSVFRVKLAEGCRSERKKVNLNVTKITRNRGKKGKDNIA